MGSYCGVVAHSLTIAILLTNILKGLITYFTALAAVMTVLSNILPGAQYYTSGYLSMSLHVVLDMFHKVIITHIRTFEYTSGYF